MAKYTVVEEVIFVQDVKKYSVVVNGVMYGVNAPLQPSNFEKGKSYKVSIKVLTDSGKKYINACLAQYSGAPTPAAMPTPTPAPAAAPAMPPPTPYPGSPAVPAAPAALSTPPPGGQAPVRPATGSPATGHAGGCKNNCPACESMWATKDVRIGRQSLLKTVLLSPAFAGVATALDPSAVLDLAKTWADNLEQYVNR